MTSYRRSAPSTHLSCAGESSGAYDHCGPDRDPDDPGPAQASPLPGLVDALDDLEASKRRVLAQMRDVAAWGGTATTTGYTRSEYVALVGRLPGREAWKFDLLVSRLPAAPVTAVLLDRGELTIDQAVSILAGTKRLSGEMLAEVEAAAAEAAVGRNRRGDDPDVDADVDVLVQRTKKAAEQDRLDRDRLDRNQVRVQPDLWGAGRITEDWADPEGFQTRLAAIEHAAGPPTPDLPRGQQLAEGSLATARAWLAGRSTHPLADPGPADVDRRGLTADASAPVDVDAAHPGPDLTPAWSGTSDHRDHDPADVDTTVADRIDQPLLDLGLSSARPTLVVRIDVRDLAGIDPDDPDALHALAAGTPAAFGRLAAAGRLSSTPWLGRQLLDTLACNADLLVAIVDGERPLAEFRPTRRLPDRIRRQVLWRDMGCRWPSCRAPIAHCDVHHLDEHPTNHSVDNLLTLCRRHHRRLHSTFWHPRLDGHTGRFDLLRSPTGAPVHTTYPRGTDPTVLTTAALGGDPPEVH